ncbi:MAG: glucosyltransferase domain-containing protein [Eubacteriales bacterium]|nr:glucosyltransferase domain-containing protein [Eubacteriales bacterium]
MSSTKTSQANTDIFGYLSDFLAYLKSHILYTIGTYLFIITLYGSWAFQDIVTFDEEGLYSAYNASIWYEQWISLGRFSLVALKRLLNVYVISPFFSMTVFLLLFPLSVLLVNYCLYLWNQRKDSPLASFLMLFVYLTHPIWALQFQYQNQIEVISVIFCVLPIGMIALYDYLRTKRPPAGILALLLLVFSFGGYQSFIFVYLELAVVMLLLMLDWAYISRREVWKDFLRIIFFTIIAFAIYEAIVIVTRRLFGSSVPYLNSQIEWKTQPFSECAAKTMQYLRKLFLGTDTYVYSKLFGLEALLLLVWGCVLFIRKKKFSPERLLLVLAWMICPVLLGIVTTGNLVERAEFAFIFAIGSGCYLLFRSIDSQNRYCKSILALVLCLAVIRVQMVPITRLLYTGSVTMRNDARWMDSIYRLAEENGAAPGDAIWFIGGQVNFDNGAAYSNEVIGISYFEITGFATDKAVQAMQDYGYNVCSPSQEQIEEASRLAQDMPNWPARESVQVKDHLIVVKMS